MTAYVFHTAATLDGFLADENDSLDWLLSRQIDEGGPLSVDEQMTRTGAIVMGSTTYQWLLDHEDLASADGRWPYRDFTTFVFSTRDPVVVDPSIRIVSGTPTDLRERIEEAAGDKDVWVVGGGDLAAQFAEASMLDEMIVSFAPATVGSGRPLFPRAHDFELLDTARNRDFLIGRYRVV